MGFIAIQFNNEITAEIQTFGIMEKYHRKGIGGKLIRKVCKRIEKDGYKLLIVKTLSNTVIYEPYERTRKFYYKCGFLPIDTYPKIWGKENPCLIMVKVLNPKRKR